MGEITADKTDYFMTVKGPELIKKKFAGIPIEMPVDEISRQCVYDAFLEGKPVDEIIESLIEIQRPGSRLPSGYSFIKKKYGEQKALQLLKAQQENGELNAELFDSIVGVGATKNSEPVKASNHASTTNKDQYIGLRFEVINDPEFRKLFKGQYLTYAFLRRYIIRKPFKYDHLNLYENYFQKGQLASSCSIGWLATCFECSPNTIRKHMRKLKNTGCFKVVPVPRKDAWDGQKHNIYIFGTHDGSGKAKYYIDEVFDTPPIPDGQGVQ